MTDLVEALRLEGDRRVCEKEMTFGNSKSREDRIADDLCYQAASRISQQDAELERLRREVEEAKEFRAILEGHLSAAIDDYNEARREQFDAMVDARMEAFFVGWEMSHAASVEDTCAEAWEFWRLMEDGRDEVEARAPGDLQAQGGEE